MRNRIRHRPHGLEPKLPILVAPQNAPAIRSLLVPIRVLRVVMPGVVGFPDVDGGIGDWVAGGVAEGAADETGLAGAG